MNNNDFRDRSRPGRTVIEMDRKGNILDVKLDVAPRNNLPAVVESAASRLLTARNIAAALRGNQLAVLQLSFDLGKFAGERLAEALFDAFGDRWFPTDAYTTIYPGILKNNPKDGSVVFDGDWTEVSYPTTSPDYQCPGSSASSKDWAGIYQGPYCQSTAPGPLTWSTVYAVTEAQFETMYHQKPVVSDFGWGPRWFVATYGESDYQVGSGVRVAVHRIFEASTGSYSDADEAAADIQIIGNAPAFKPVPVVVPENIPNPASTLVPDWSPIASVNTNYQAMPRPISMTKDQPIDWLPPHQQRRSSYYRFDPAIDVDPPKPPTRIDEIPYVEDPVVIETTSPNGPPISPPPRVHLKQPPSYGKEKKARAGVLAGLTLNAVSLVTEAKDVVDAIWDALPDKFKPRYKNTRHVRRSLTPQAKLRVLYEHWEEIDADAAVRNIANNQLEDAVIGVGGSLAKKRSKEFGDVTGSVKGLLTGGARNRYGNIKAANFARR